MSENKLVNNVKEALALVAISAGIGWATKKALRKAVTNDPSASVMNMAEWVAVMTGGIYARDYLIDQKIIPNWGGFASEGASPPLNPPPNRGGDITLGSITVFVAGRRC